MKIKVLKTQLVIIGGGPAGMLLAHSLDLLGIKSIVIEKKSKQYVLSRIRAGMLEYGTVEFLRNLGLTERLDSECYIQRKVHYGFEGKDTLILDLEKYTGKTLIAYGQTSITRDIYEFHKKSNRPYFDNINDTEIYNIQDKPFVTFSDNEQQYRVDCDFIVGCDGSYGISRQAIPASNRQEWEKVYPFGWLGVLTEVPPMEELFYAKHSDGFLLASKRSPTLSRYYLQVPLTDKIEDWSDDRFWEAVLKRLPEEYRDKVTTGKSIEKSIAPLRSFVFEPMQYGNLYLAGDAAHVVPPTGAKGLNLAVSDIYYLSSAFDFHYNHANSKGLTEYKQTALNRVWTSVNLSWRLTMLLHSFPNESRFDAKIRENDFDLLLKYEPMRVAMAFEKVGIPY